ncbi:conserved hypothetical protein [Trichinella spiralis]|uniref:hypothetical protein n=1 Tax=Trichinella spiralis TaxID=6334 RepID=UPI0001EFE1ED|nr:conserved hypothetical protein [Trichinella spiralis]
MAGEDFLLWQSASRHILVLATGSNIRLMATRRTWALDVKLLPFWPHSPRLWFAQAEAQFALQHVSASVIKYYYVIASLPDSVGPDVNDLLEPAGDPPYETLKRRLLERYGESDDNRFNALMNSALAGDTKSSQLLREMR